MFRPLPDDHRMPAICKRTLFIALILFALTSLAQVARFQNPPMIDTPVDPAGIIAGDWNGDGHQDVVYIESSPTPTLHVLLGNGKGRFTNGASLKLPAGTCGGYIPTGCWMFAGDFNNDGKQDILTSGMFSGQEGFVVIPGHGDGTFGTPIVSQFPSYDGDSFFIHQVTVADFNGDGNLDVLVPSYYTDTVTLYLGDGTGAFKMGNSWGWTEPVAAYAADLNHDGKMDAIIFQGAYGDFYTHAVSVWLGDGSGNLTFSQSYPASLSPLLPVCMADVNGDGNLDVIGYDQSGNVQVMLGQNDGTFSAPTTILTSPFGEYPQSRSLTLTDVNGDGILDMIHPSSTGIDIIVGQAGLTFGSPQPQTFGSLLTNPVPADFDEDGTIDSVFGVQGGIQFFFGKHQSVFPDATIHPTPAPVTLLFAGDFNRDGISDVVALDSSGNIETFPGASNGQFGAPIQTSASLTAGGDGGSTGDFDGDGKLDIYLGGSPGQVLYGNGDGSFSILSIGAAPSGLVADLNNDGRSDLVSIAPFDSLGTGYGLIAMLGNAGRGFSIVSTQFPDVGGITGIETPALLALGDVNGDGKADAVVFNPNKPALEAWFGNGDGTFHLGQSTTITTSGLTPLGAGVPASLYGTGFIADLDGDGNKDLVFLATLSTPANSSPSYVMVVIYGDGTGNFTAPQIIALSHNYTNLVPATLYVGGRPSFVVSDGNLIGVIRNLGGRQYSGEEFYTAGSFVNTLISDFNGDGLGDILVNRANPLQYPAQSNGSFTVLLNMASANGNVSGAINGELVVNPTTAAYNQAFTITATLQGANSGDPTPTGTVTFNVAGTQLGTVALQSGVATLQVPGSTTKTLPAGDLLAVGSYSGDLNYGSAEMTAVLDVLEPVYATSTSLTLEADGQTVSSVQAGSFVSLVANVSAAQPVTSGTVSFYDGTTVIGQTTIAAGQATFGTNLLSIGPHTLSTRYLGIKPAAAATFQPSTSSPVTLTITADSTTATLTPSATSLTAGSVLTLTTKVNSTTGTPIGGVTFSDGTQALITLSLDATGTAAFSTASLATGTHTLTARYNANASYAGSVTNTATVTVNSALASQEATITVISGLQPASGGQGGQLLVQVLPQSSKGPITGRVSLIVDGQLADTGSLSENGSVLLILAITDPGLHVIQASYAGTNSAAPSVSDPFRTTMYLNDQDFTLSAGPVVQSANGPRVVLTVAPTGTWTKAVRLSCTGVPVGYSCNISPSIVTGEGKAVLILESGRSALAIALILPCGLLFFDRRLRLIRRTILISLLLLFSISCGTPTRFTSSVVMVEASSGNLTHSIQIVIRTSRPVS